jgi:hypothetical protein
MPKKIANKDLPAADAVNGGTELVAAVAKRKARFEKVKGAATPDAARVRAARKKVKRGQRKLRKQRIRTALSTKAAPAAAGS